MGDNSAIEWKDATWSPTVGCSVLSPGCTNGVVQLNEQALTLPLSWKKPRRIFVNSMSDLFHASLPDEAIDKVFAVMALAPQHTFQILTKRAERMRRYVHYLCNRDDLIADAALKISGWPANAHPDRTAERRLEIMRKVRNRHAPLPNVWLGVSVEDQARADERIPMLLATPAAVRFLSCEPLLGPIDFKPCYLTRKCITYGCPSSVPGAEITCPCADERIDWVIVGGESGPGARPFDIAWARSIIEQCKAADVACFVKQLGAKPITQRAGDLPDYEFDFRDRKGGDPEEWPIDLRIREFPRGH